ncbi:MAG: hypothetical protein NTW71_07810 [Deltaproteobacteria bacterium]|nr:hypothetical protein [Deltaproteobacteria bacterium]
MEDPKAKPSGMDAIKKGLDPDGSYLIIETHTGPERATVLAEVAEAVERFRDRGIIGCDIHREPGDGRVFFLVKLEADKVDDVMNDFLALAGARNRTIYVYRRRPIQESLAPAGKGRPED